MKNISKIILILILSLSFSGCTSNTTTTTTTTTTGGDTSTTQISAKKIEKRYFSGILKSVNSGKTWQEKTYVGKDEKDNVVSIGDSFVYDIKTSPINPKTLVASTRNNGLYISYNQGEQWEPLFNQEGTDVKLFSFSKVSPRTFYVGYKNKVYKTVNAGLVWDVLYVDKDTNIAAVFNDPEYSENVYIFTLDGRIINLNDQGLSSLYDFKSEGSTIRDVYFYNFTAEIFYVLFNNNSIYRTDNYGANFVKLTNIPQGQVVIDTQSASTDFDSVGVLGDTTTTTTSSTNIRIIKLFPNDINSFMLSTDSGLYKTRDKGNSFEEIHLLTINKKINSLDLSSKNPDVFYYSIGDLLYKTINNGVNWTVVETPVNRTISTINIDLQNNEILYMGINTTMQGIESPQNTSLMCDMFGLIIPSLCN